MHYRSFFLILAILAAAATSFPPYLWGQERIEKWNFRAAHDLGARGTDPTFAPIKARGFLLASNFADFQLGWTWDNDTKKSIPLTEKLQRRVSWGDLLLEYVLAVCVAAIVGALVPPRRFQIIG